MGSPVPTPTIAPSAYGLNSYAPQSSQTNQYASNYQTILRQSVPNSSTQLNAFGAPLYNTNSYGTTNRVANTNVNTGALISTSQPGTASVQQQVASQPSAEEQARNAYFSYLDNQYNQLPGLQSSLSDQINNLFNSQSGSINSSLDQTLNSLGTSKNNITDNKTSSLRDLGNQMMNQLKAGNTYLGVRGASDSTAGNQLAYALGKIGTQQRSGIEKQANQLYAQVDTQIANAKSVAQDQLNQLNTWKNNQLLQVTDYINQLRGNIDQAKQQYIQSWLANIDNQVSNYKNTVASWIVNKADSLNQVVSQLQQYGIAPNTSIANGTISSPMWGQSGQNSGTQLYGTVGSPKYDQFGNIIQ